MALPQYTEGTPEFKERRNKIANEVQKDMNKSLDQLMVDVYDEILREDRTLFENQVHAMKRFTCLLAKTIKSSEKQGAVIAKLTWAVVILTIVLILLTVV